MTNLRIIGLIIGIFGLFLTFRIYRGPRWRKLNFILFGAFSLLLIAISIDPDLLNAITDALSLQRGPQQQGRLLFLLIGSIIFLWFLVLYLKNGLDEYKYQFDHLIRKLGYEEISNVLKKETTDKQIMVIIPAYNELENLKELLKRIPPEVDNKKVGVLVIDDGSTDGTFETLRKTGYLCVKNKVKRGGGAALRSAYDILRNIQQIEVCVTMDADGQHLPEEIEKLTKPILENKYDLVIGSRILGEREKDNSFRFIGIYVFNAIIRLLLGIRITDCSSGFRAFRTDLLDKVVLREDQYHTSELIINTAKKGMRIGEVPVTILRRKYGTSKKGKNWSYGVQFAKSILKAWWR